MTTVSNLAFCCAHCGFLEPANIEEIENDESCTVGCVYVHKDDCRAQENGVEHDLFMALWNARIHMELNDVLLRRANENLINAMRPYIENQLSDESFFVKKEPSKFWL